MSTSLRPTTPLRRVSRGSLSALSQSQRQNAASDTPLTFLQGALADLCDDASALHANLEQLNAIHDALGVFDESFAMFLYGLKMNAFCVEWPQAPADENFDRARERNDVLSQQASKQQQLQSAHLAAGFGAGEGGDGDTTLLANDSASTPRARTTGAAPHLADQTYMTQDDEEDVGANAPARAPASSLKNSKPAATSTLRPALKRPTAVGATKPATAAGATSSGGPAKGKITVAQKKKREAYARDIIETLPLEYRGNDPKPRALAESVLMALIAAGGKGVRVADIAKPPELPQAKVNKALIALVAAKHVVKSSNNGIVYSLDAARHPSLP